MGSIYTYRNTTDFNGNLSHSNKQNFRNLINDNGGISQNCLDVVLNGDVVEVWFENPLTHPEEAVLASLVTLRYNDAYYFDATVDCKGTGDYVKIADAFAAGKTSVYVRDGTYIETANIVLPDGGQLIGESQSNVKIVLVAGNSIVVDGSKGVKINTGTIAIANHSQTVIGTGTTFTSILPASFILLGTNFYTIASVESDTSLTLADTYSGGALAGVTCLAQQMFTGVKISNVVIVNPPGSPYSTTGLYLRGLRHCSFKGIAALYCTPNIQVLDTGDCSLYEFICGFSNGVGLAIDNVHSVLWDTLDVYNSTSHGIQLTTRCSSNVFHSCSSSNNGGNGLSISADSYDVNISNGVIKHNNDRGLFADAGSSKIIVSCCTFIDNISHGVHLLCSNSVASNNIIDNNKANGVVGGGTNCIVTGNQITNNTGDGLAYIAGESCVISTNRIDSNGGHGINVVDNHAIISGNIVCNNGACGILSGSTNGNIAMNNVHDNASHGLELTAASSLCIVGQNQINLNTGTGLLIDAGSSNSILTNNIVLSNIAANLTDNGSGNVLNGNKTS